MDINGVILEKLKAFGIGRRKLDDKLFCSDKPLQRLGTYDVDEENLCHDIIKTSCHIPGCIFEAESLLEFENHYNATHRYSCGQCRKLLPSPHLLDLHIQETHDSFFAIMSEKTPSYCCYIEECKEKFQNADSRLDHCVKVHKLPKNFRFNQRPKYFKSNKTTPQSDQQMDLDKRVPNQKFFFNNNKQKAFAKYTGRKFTGKNPETNLDVNMEDVINDLKENLPN